MVWAEAVLLLCALGLTTLATQHLVRLRRDTATHAEHLRRTAAAIVEIRELRALQKRIGDVQQFAESVIDTSTSTVRAVHMGISRIPFDILEQVSAARDTARVVRDTHDAVADAIYGTIRGINRLAGKATRQVIGNKAERRPPSEAGPSSPNRPRKPE